MARASRRRVVVTGIGMITPLGPDTEETFENCAHGRSGIERLTAFDPRGLPCDIGGRVRDEWLGKEALRGARRLHGSRSLRLLMAAARQGADRSELAKIPSRDRVGVAVGSFGDPPAIEDVAFLHRFYDPAHGWDLDSLKLWGGYNPVQFFRRKPDTLATALAAALRCEGPSLATVSSCAAGAQAIGEAFRIVQAGGADVMVAGGSEAILTFTCFLGFVLLKALAERYESPATASRPFDRKRNGFVLSEGAGIVVLEEREHARRRGALPLGEILGYGSTSDAYRITDTHPRGEAAAAAMRAALDDARLPPEAVHCINAHGTSTVKNDAAESLAIETVFGSLTERIPVTSNKSMLGHAIAASGAIEFILALEGMRRSVLLPTINHDHPDPKCGLRIVANQALCLPHRVALSNSFGFGGHNACLCLRGGDG